MILWNGLFFPLVWRQYAVGRRYFTSSMAQTALKDLATSCLPISVRACAEAPYAYA